LAGRQSTWKKRIGAEWNGAEPMPWVSTRELPNNRRGKVNYAAKREYERTWQVQMSSASDGSIQVSVAPGIPFMFTPYQDADGSFDLGAVLYDLSAEQQDDMLHWIVTGKYASGERSRYSRYTPEKGDTRFNDPNPLNRPPQFIFGSAKYQRPILLDLYGIPLTNSAFDAFDPPVMVEEERTTVTIIQNEPFYDPSVSAAYQGAINSDEFLGNPKFSCKMTERSGRSNVENNFLYWEVTYQFEFRRVIVDSVTPHRDGTTDAQTFALPGGFVQFSYELGWLEARRNEGFYQLVLVNNKLQYAPILDGKGKPVVTPKDLDLPDAQKQVLPLGARSQPIYFVFHVRPELPFSPMITGAQG
jgi:hypothetical protein